MGNPPVTHEEPEDETQTVNNALIDLLNAYTIYIDEDSGFYADDVYLGEYTPAIHILDVDGQLNLSNDTIKDYVDNYVESEGCSYEDVPGNIYFEYVGLGTFSIHFDGKGYVEGFHIDEVKDLLKECINDGYYVATSYYRLTV